MTCLRRNKTTGPHRVKGTLTTDLDEIDDIIHDVMGGITDGNSKDIRKTVLEFQEQYRQYMHKSKPFEVKEIVYEEFRELCLKGGDSAPGLDGWSNKDLALLSDGAIRLMVDFLNAIEKGAPWPETMRQTRAVFLSKDPDDTANPLAYRALKITSSIYRKWATYRNRTLEDWVMSWQDKAMNSGIPGKGGTDAWYHTALHVELQRLSGQEVSGGSVDIYKCFDQINRDLLKEIAITAGMPERVVAFRKTL
jgi:hypothetical protein